MGKDKPRVVAWMMSEEIADDDPLAAVKRRALALDAAAEELEAAARRGHAAARADAIGQAAAMLADPAFTLDEAYEAAERAMPPAMVNAAGHIAATLAEVECYGWVPDD